MIDSLMRGPALSCLARKGAECRPASIAEGALPAILVLEDQPEIRSMVHAMVRSRGIACDTAGTLREAQARIAAGGIDIVIADIRLPDGDGLALLEPAGAPLLLAMTGDGGIDTVITAIRRGAIDFVPKPFTVGELLSRLDRAVEFWREKTARGTRGDGLERRAVERVETASLRLAQVHEGTVDALITALELNDRETADHCARVARNSVILGSRLGLSELELRDLRWGACLHDVGKIGIPPRILRKPSKLTSTEWSLMRRHPALGSQILRSVDFLAAAGDVVEFHHERFDGNGYPHGISGEQIPLPARIFAVADTLDAITSNRPYRIARPFADAASEIVRLRGSQFDPRVVEAFLAVPPASGVLAKRT
jgi:response regulator RpfG family c-di-GMP phosphodiesterase